MTNLTEQLATESLPEYTEFYVRKKDGSTDTHTWLNRRHSSAVEWWNTFNITEVLAPVPSYEEWKTKLEENAKLKTEYEKECHRADELEDSYWKAEKENQKLKKLLKECESSIQYYQETYGAMDLDTYTLLAKLNEVLK